jgi:hypothetical protein
MLRSIVATLSRHCQGQARQRNADPLPVALFARVIRDRVSMAGSLCLFNMDNYTANAFVKELST